MQTMEEQEIATLQEKRDQIGASENSWWHKLTSPFTNDITDPYDIEAKLKEAEAKLESMQNGELSKKLEREAQIRYFLTLAIFIAGAIAASVGFDLLAEAMPGKIARPLTQGIVSTVTMGLGLAGGIFAASTVQEWKRKDNRVVKAKIANKAQELSNITETVNAGKKYTESKQNKAAYIVCKKENLNFKTEKEFLKSLDKMKTAVSILERTDIKGTFKNHKEFINHYKKITALGNIIRTDPKFKPTGTNDRTDKNQPKYITKGDDIFVVYEKKLYKLDYDANSPEEAKLDYLTDYQETKLLNATAYEEICKNYPTNMVQRIQKINELDNLLKDTKDVLQTSTDIVGNIEDITIASLQESLEQKTFDTLKRMDENLKKHKYTNDEIRDILHDFNTKMQNNQVIEAYNSFNKKLFFLKIDEGNNIASKTAANINDNIYLDCEARKNGNNTVIHTFGPLAVNEQITKSEYSTDEIRDLLAAHSLNDNDIEQIIKKLKYNTNIHFTCVPIAQNQLNNDTILLENVADLKNVITETFKPEKAYSLTDLTNLDINLPDAVQTTGGNNLVTNYANATHRNRTVYTKADIRNCLVGMGLSQDEIERTMTILGQRNGTIVNRNFISGLYDGQAQLDDFNTDTHCFLADADELKEIITNARKSRAELNSANAHDYDKHEETEKISSRNKDSLLAGIQELPVIAGQGPRPTRTNTLDHLLEYKTQDIRDFLMKNQPLYTDTQLDTIIKRLEKETIVRDAPNEAGYLLIKDIHDIYGIISKYQNENTKLNVDNSALHDDGTPLYTKEDIKRMISLSNGFDISEPDKDNIAKTVFEEYQKDQTIGQNKPEKITLKDVSEEELRRKIEEASLDIVIPDHKVEQIQTIQKIADIKQELSEKLGEINITEHEKIYQNYSPKTIAGKDSIGEQLREELSEYGDTLESRALSQLSSFEFSTKGMAGIDGIEHDRTGLGRS